MSETIDFETSDLSVSENSVDIEAMLASLSPDPDYSSLALDTFDRIVNDLPSYYGYLSYQLSNSTYVLLSGSEYSISSGSVYFGSDCVVCQVSFDEYGEASLNAVNSPNSSLTLESGTIYYTNLISGYPSLGDRVPDYPFFLFVGLVCAFSVIIFNRSSRR